MYIHLPQEPNIIDSFLGISANLWGFIGTLVLGIIAIFGDQIKKAFLKPKIRGVQLVTTWQKIENIDEAVIFTRLIVKNIGSSSAKDVRALLTYSDYKMNF